MEYSLLGQTGVRVSKLTLGTFPFGVAPLAKDVDKLVGRAIELGINVIDTANSYGNQARFDRPGAPPAAERASAEEMVGKALKGRRNEVLVCTKVQEWMYDGPNGGGATGGGLTRRHIMEQVEQSLKRLGTDHIDIYHMHHPDTTTPIEQTLRAMDDLVHQGKVLYIGLSTFNAGRMVEALWTADKLGLNKPVLNQVPYNLSTRFVERDIQQVAVRHGLSLTAFTALDGGLLAGIEVTKRPSRMPSTQREGRPVWSDAQIEVAEKLEAAAKESGHPPAHLALAWLLSRSALASALVGPENIAELEQNVGAVDVKLTESELEVLDGIGPLQSFWEFLFV